MKRKQLYEKETYFENETNLRKVNTCEEETSILKRQHHLKHLKQYLKMKHILEWKEHLKPWKKKKKTSILKRQLIVKSQKEIKAKAEETHLLR